VRVAPSRLASSGPPNGERGRRGVPARFLPSRGWSPVLPADTACLPPPARASNGAPSPRGPSAYTQVSAPTPGASLPSPTSWCAWPPCINGGTDVDGGPSRWGTPNTACAQSPWHLAARGAKGRGRVGRRGDSWSGARLGSLCRSSGGADAHNGAHPRLFILRGVGGLPTTHKLHVRRHMFSHAPRGSRSRGRSAASSHRTQSRHTSPRRAGPPGHKWDSSVPDGTRVPGPSTPNAA
jgi:hypothetical protein